MRLHLLWATAAILVLAALMFTACGPATQSAPGEQSVPRVAQPGESASTPTPTPTTSHNGGEGPPTLVAANTEFAVNFYHALREPDDRNLFFSPYSLSVALAMTHAGAAGETRQQMAEVLSIQSLPQEDIYGSFRDLQNSLMNPANTLGAMTSELPRLEIGNAIWRQTRYEVLPEFADIILNSFGADVMQADFRGNPAESAEAVNRWASESTNGKITQIIDPSDEDKIKGTRLMLANAVYLKGDWQYEFQESDTEQQSFYLQNGGSVLVPMMHQTEFLNYAETEDYQAVELPYRGGDLSAIVVLPREDKFQGFEATMDGETIRHIQGRLLPTEVEVNLSHAEIPGWRRRLMLGSFSPAWG